jgi:CRISPR-associated protein Csd2
MTIIANRYDFILLFDVIDGNPNGDPDAGNQPRLDPETNQGLVSDVSLKRKIRNYAEFARGGEPGYAVYVQEGAILNDKHRQAYAAVRSDGERSAKASRLNPQSDEEAEALRRFMCANFFDIRTFGAVMGTGINCGQVRGPVQLTFARSLEPVLPLEIAITRMAATAADEKARSGEEEPGDARQERRTIGRKYIIPYGLYRAHGHVSAKLAERTGFSEADLGLLWEALTNMFDHDRSAARGEIAARRLIVFKHASALGNAPAHRLFERVVVARAVKDAARATIGEGVDGLPPARRYADYRVTIDQDGLTSSVQVLDLI